MAIKFQYILCYGSTTTVIPQNANQKNFNTSYVTVQHLSQQYHANKKDNFNTSYVTVQQVGNVIEKLYLYYFNTSYVTVQHCLPNRYRHFFLDFNTSYVTVQPCVVNGTKIAVAFQYILCYGSTIAVHMIYAFHYTGITLKHQQFL